MARSANYNGTLIGDDVFEGDVHDLDNRPAASPEVELWLAVVSRIWEDAFVSSNVSIRNTDRHCDPDMIRAEARRWLLLNHGDWRRDREEICARAGVCPDAIHSAAVRRNKLAKAEDTERNRRERVSVDMAMARLVERAPFMMLGRVNRAMRELSAREDALV